MGTNEELERLCLKKAEARKQESDAILEQVYLGLMLAKRKG